MADSIHGSGFLDTHKLQQLKLPKVAIVHTEWNEKIVRELVNGCESYIHKFTGDIIENLAVPGCFELPYGCRNLWEHYKDKIERPEAIIALGAVVRGDTPHFDYVCRAVTDGILQLNLTLPIPVIFGVLTVDNEDQAWARLGGDHGHKGEEAAITALKMVALNRSRI